MSLENKALPPCYSCPPWYPRVTVWPQHCEFNAVKPTIRTCAVMPRGQSPCFWGRKVPEPRRDPTALREQGCESAGQRDLWWSSWLGEVVAELLEIHPGLRQAPHSVLTG